jgi:hypothetical protein
MLCRSLRLPCRMHDRLLRARLHRPAPASGGYLGLATNCARNARKACWTSSTRRRPKASGLVQDVAKAEQRAKFQTLTAPVDGVCSSSRFTPSEAWSRRHRLCWCWCRRRASSRSRPRSRRARQCQSRRDTWRKEQLFAFAAIPPSLKLRHEPAPADGAPGAMVPYSPAQSSTDNVPVRCYIMRTREGDSGRAWRCRGGPVTPPSKPELNCR